MRGVACVDGQVSGVPLQPGPLHPLQQGGQPSSLVTHLHADQERGAIIIIFIIFLVITLILSSNSLQELDLANLECAGQEEGENVAKTTEIFTLLREHSSMAPSL